MSIDHDLLLKYGLNCFGISVALALGDSGQNPFVNIVTFPVRDEITIGEAQCLIPDLMEEGVLFGSCRLSLDGSVYSSGFRQGIDKALASILRGGRDRYLSRLELMFSEHAYTEFLVDAAIITISTGLSLREIAPKAICYEHTNLFGLDTLLRGMLTDLLTPMQAVYCPGALCELPPEFAAEFNERQEKAFHKRLSEYLKLYLPILNQKTRVLLERIKNIQQELDTDSDRR